MTDISDLTKRLAAIYDIKPYPVLKEAADALERATALSDPELKRRAMHCVTHHMACDCREAMLQQQALDREAEIERLRSEVQHLDETLDGYVEAQR